MNYPEWLTQGWEKILTIIVSIIGAIWAVARKFNGRVELLEGRVTALEREVQMLQTRNSSLESMIVSSFERIDHKFKEVLDLRVFVERQDVMLRSIHEDLRDIKDDVKRLMRDE